MYMFDNIKQKFSAILKEHRLGELLVKRGYITEEQLQEALQESRETGEKIGKTLINLGHITTFQLYRKIIMQWQLRFGTIGILLMMQVFAPITAYADTISKATSTYKISYNNISASKANAEQPKMFGYKEFKSDDINAFTKWTNAIERFDRQMDDPNMNTANVTLWQQELNKIENKSAKEQVKAVNDLINKYRYIEDKDNYAKSDYWATPIEFFANGGDCEDFAIAKYASLKALGFSPDQMRIAIVKDTVKNIHHAILVVSVGSETFVLDNQNKKVETVTRVTRYQPIFSINSNSWWLHEKA